MAGRKKGIGQIVTDLERQLNDDYNALIQLTVEGLSTEKNSPVDTGFLHQAGKQVLKKSVLRINERIMLHGQAFIRLAHLAVTSGLTQAKNQQEVKLNRALPFQSSTLNVNQRYISATPLSTQVTRLNHQK